MGQNQGKHTSRAHNKVVVVRGVLASPSYSTRAVYNNEWIDRKQSATTHGDTHTGVDVTRGMDATSGVDTTSGKSSVHYVEEVATMDFADLDEDEEDSSSNNTGTEQLVDSEGLSDKFHKWFRESRKIFHRDQNAREGWDWETEPGIHGNLQLKDEAEVNFQLPRVNVKSTRVREIKDIGITPNGSVPAVEIPSLEEVGHHGKHQSASPIVIRQKHSRWSKKRSLPEQYICDTSMNGVQSSTEHKQQVHNHIDQGQIPHSLVTNQSAGSVHVHFDRRVMIAEPGTGFDSLRSSLLSDQSEEQRNRETNNSVVTSGGVGTGFDAPVPWPDPKHTKPKRVNIINNGMWEPEPDYDNDDVDENVATYDDVCDNGPVYDTPDIVHNMAPQWKFKHEKTFINYMSQQDDSRRNDQVYTCTITREEPCNGNDCINIIILYILIRWFMSLCHIDLISIRS